MIWLWLNPMLESTAAVSVWIVVTACEPVSVPFWMAFRSSWTWPIDAFVGCASLDRSLLRSDWSVWNADCTAEIEAVEPEDVELASGAVDAVVPAEDRYRRSW